LVRVTYKLCRATNILVRWDTCFQTKWKHFQYCPSICLAHTSYELQHIKLKCVDHNSQQILTGASTAYLISFVLGNLISSLDPKVVVWSPTENSSASPEPWSVTLLIFKSLESRSWNQYKMLYI
jgi:hypothetical protein